MTSRAEDLGAVHFIGMGGAGMSGIARIMAMRGISVSGCDLKDSRALVSLRALGVKTYVGHDPSHLDGVDTVVYSSAVRSTSPELQAAISSGRTVLQRAEALASLMADRRVIAVAGTHGKTTTTSLLSVVLQQAGLDPSFAIGGTITDSGAHAHDGAGEFFVVEADESDGSFVHYRPEIAIVTNIEADHMDHYADTEAVTTAFKEFAATVSGPLIVCGDDPNALSLLKEHPGYSYGWGDHDLRLSELKSSEHVSFTAAWQGNDLGRFELSVAGSHNALNAGAVIVAALLAGVSVEQIKQGLRTFTGTRRRFEVRGTGAKVTVIDDYAHHPTEIAATISAARDVFPGRRLIAVFQPHRYSRTAAFMSEFATALTQADVVLITEVYAAGEETIPGATGAALAQLTSRNHVHVVFEPSLTKLAEQVDLLLDGQPTVVLAMGAGDITLACAEIVERVCVEH